MFHRMTRALLGPIAVALLSLATSVRAGQYQVATASLGGPGPCSATWINDSGDVAGTGYMQNGLQHAFLFSGGTIQALDLPGGSYSVCVGLNPQGWVLGESMKGTPASPGGFIGYFLYADGVTDNLGTSYPSGLILSDDFGDVNLGTPNLSEPLSSLFPDWYYAQANAANSSGQIAGDGVNGNGDPVVFLLTPVPEPSTLALLAVSAIGLIGYVWRRKRMTRRLLAMLAAVAVLSVASATISRANTLPVVADSVADFSGNQGQNGWYYGYNRQPGGPFTELSYYPSVYGAWGNGSSPWGTAGFVEIGSDWQQSNASIPLRLIHTPTGRIGDGSVTLAALSSLPGRLDVRGIRLWVMMELSGRFGSTIKRSGHKQVTTSNRPLTRLRVLSTSAQACTSF